jgi:hypothetical protein
MKWLPLRHRITRRIARQLLALLNMMKQRSKYLIWMSVVMITLSFIWIAYIGGRSSGDVRLSLSETSLFASQTRISLVISNQSRRVVSIGDISVRGGNQLSKEVAWTITDSYTNPIAPTKNLIFPIDLPPQISNHFVVMVMYSEGGAHPFRRLISKLPFARLSERFEWWAFQRGLLTNEMRFFWTSPLVERIPTNAVASEK